MADSSGLVLLAIGTSGEECGTCSRPARFEILVAEPAARYRFCNLCVIGFVLQTLKLNGVKLQEIEEVVPYLSMLDGWDNMQLPTLMVQ